MLTKYQISKIKCKNVISVFKHKKVHKINCNDFRLYNCQDCYKLMNYEEALVLLGSTIDDEHHYVL
jgi:hypothetical protein